MVLMLALEDYGGAHRLPSILNKILIKQQNVVLQCVAP